MVYMSGKASVQHSNSESGAAGNRETLTFGFDSAGDYKFFVFLDLKAPLLVWSLPWMFVPLFSKVKFWEDRRCLKIIRLVFS